MLGAVAGLVDEAERVAAGFAPALAAATQAAWRDLAARGRLHPDAAPPDGELPWAFREMLASAIAVEEREGSERAALLRRHYLELMPRQRVEQMATAAEPNATLLHTRLDPARLPRLRGALARLYALLEDAGVDPAGALPAATPEALLVNFPTVARLYAVTHYGGFMPLLYGTPADLARAAADLDDVQTKIDRHLTAPIVHELAHFGRRRRGLLPLYLDECVAGHVGVLAHRAFAYPTDEDVDALYASPWFAQVGQALARVVGTRALVRAHAGAAEWRDVLPDGFLDEALAAGWNEYLERRGPHFLSDSFRPDPWLARILAHGAPPLDDDDEAADEDIVADALRAMCLENRVEDGAYVVRTRPPPGPIVVDVAARRVTAPLRAGTADTVPPAYFLPPAVARRLEGLGIKALSVEIDDPGKVPVLAAVLRRADLRDLGPWRASFS